MNLTPTVSVIMITYNHEKYIKQAIEGVLMQKCNFEIELIIANDCSTDKTDEIVQNILNSDSRSSIIKYVNHSTNIGMMPNFLDALKKAKGKYIAICEGDDYWVNSGKLEQQLEVLEQNLDSSVCFHATKYIHKDISKDFVYRPSRIPKKGKFSIKHAIVKGGGFMKMNSMFFRQNFLREIPDYMYTAPVADVPLMLLLAFKGNISYIDEPMSAYRVMAQGSYSASLKKKRNTNKTQHYLKLKMWDDFDKWSNYEYHNFVLLKKMKNKIFYCKQLLS